jgi:ABC-2 type transport system permease protein
MAAGVRVNRPVSFWSLGLGDWKNVWKWRELLFSMVFANIKSRYKGSALGLTWALLRPLATLLVYTLAVGYFLGASRNIPDFGLFLFSGLIAYNFFSDIVVAGTQSITGNSNLMKKIWFPREILPLATAGVAVVNTLFQFAVLIVAYLVLGEYPKLGALVYLVPGILILLILGLAASFVLSVVNVRYRDTQFIIEIVLQIGFWLTPIIYSWRYAVDFFNESLGAFWLSDVYVFNPLTQSIVAFQQALWPPIVTSVGQQFVLFESALSPALWGAVGASVILFWLAQRFFAVRQGKLAAQL